MPRHRGQKPSRELIGCHDCGGSVSFSASRCPHCGSTEPAGPYVLSEREQKRHRIEERNDNRLIMVTLLCCASGVAFGVLTSSTPSSSIWAGLGYGLVGAFIGVPAGFIINMSRNLFG
jgi:hypothetical protein